MTKIFVKKIGFSTYVKFAALFGASIGGLMIVMILLLFPMILLSTPKEELTMLLPLPFCFLIAPLIGTFAFGAYGIFTYPIFLIIQKILKKLTLEVELVPVEIKPQPEEFITNQNTGF